MAPPRSRDPDAAEAPDAAGLRALVDGLVSGARGGEREGASAAVAAIARPGRTAAIAAAGTTTLPGWSGPSGLAAPRPVEESTLFDLASMTKLVTALTAATMVDDGLLDLDAPVREALGDPVPDRAITARHLLTHTAGLPPTMDLAALPGGPAARREAVRCALPVTLPGAAHAYSCIGFVLLGLLLERLVGAPLPALARDRVLGPAGADGATWHVSPTDRERCAATEVQDDPPRGLVLGEVHDETAWSLTRAEGPADVGRPDESPPDGAVVRPAAEAGRADPAAGAGNAGVFATAHDALALGAVLAGTSSAPRLSAAMARALRSDQLGPAVATGEAWRQGLGTRIGQQLPDGHVAEHLVGHPGFTGTALLADPRSGAVGVLLTNRVHPRRDRFTVTGARRRLAALLVRA